jgi:hypothetical protein
MSRNLDKRKIKDVQVILGSHALQLIQKLEPIQARRIDEDPSLPASVGFIPQDFNKVFPERVRKPKGDDGAKPIKGPRPPQVPDTSILIPGAPVSSAPVDPISSAPSDPVVELPAEPVVAKTPLETLFTADPIPTVGKPSDPSAEASEEPEYDDSPTGNQGYQIESYEELTVLLCAGVKELISQLASARELISDLEKKVKKLTPSI